MSRYQPVMVFLIEILLGLDSAMIDCLVGLPI